MTLDRAAAWLLLGLAGGQTALAACPVGDNGVRMEIKLYQYAGDTTVFGQFRGVMQGKFEKMSDALRGTGAPDVSGLGFFQPVMPDPFRSRHDVDSYWKSNRYLALWRGDVEQQGTGHVAVSNIYLGDFAGPLASPEVTLAIPTTGYNAGNTLDSHSMITYYALAMNARAAHCPANVVKAFLDQALASYRNLEQRHSIDNDTAKVGKAIEDMDTRQALVHP